MFWLRNKKISIRTHNQSPIPLFDFCRDDWFDVDTKERVQSPHSKQRVQSPHSHRKYNYSSVKEKLSPPGAASTSLEDDSLPGPSRLAAEGEIHTVK